MAEKVVLEQIDVTRKEDRVVELCKGDIVGARPFHYTLAEGSSYEFKANAGYYHILVLVDGTAEFSTDGKDFTFDTRVSFVPAPDKALVVKAKTCVQLLEVQWDIFPEDEEDIKAYKTEFPVAIPYQESIQYIDPNKSEKTISRMMIPHEIIPRFTMGSVESYGYDLVRPHAHPMLDQFFFSFPENDMDVIIDDEKINMKGNVILHIPLGSNHGAEVTGSNHMHYMWIDFMPDKEAGLKRLNFSHRPTGTVRDFENEDKTR